VPQTALPLKERKSRTYAGESYRWLNLTLADSTVQSFALHNRRRKCSLNSLERSPASGITIFASKIRDNLHPNSNIWTLRDADLAFHARAFAKSIANASA
jgi:hypothetical protein